jgi:hypothetical protein
MFPLVMNFGYMYVDVNVVCEGCVCIFCMNKYLL